MSETISQRKKILVICPHPEGVAPGQRLKYEQYFESFRSNGIDVDVSPFISDSFQNILYKKGHIVQKIFGTLFGYLRRIYDLTRLRNYDGVYIFLWVTPFGPPLFESLYCRLAKSIIYDIDDMVFLAPASEANSLIAKIKGKAKMAYLMARANQVIVCTPALEEVARRYNTQVTDISSTIDTERYQPVNRYTNDRTLTLGWSGSHSTAKYLKLLESVLTRLRERYQFKVLVMGDPQFRFQSLQCEALPWSEEAEIPTLQRIDIGLYPLPLGDPWVLGKSGLKALQYMALAIPTVATAIGANFRVIDHGRSGLLVTTEDEWFEALSRLLEDTQLRKSLGEAGRETVVNRFSIRANQATYLSILHRALTEGRA